MNRETGSTDALNDVTTLIYDSGGNLTVDEEPTPGRPDGADDDLCI